MVLPLTLLASPHAPAGRAAAAVAVASCLVAALLPGGAVALEVPVRFPLRASASGRYLEDQAGRPFRVQGDTMWDAPFNLGLSDLRAYLDDRRARGFNALFGYVANPFTYYAGSSAPWAKELGGVGVTAALPFLKSLSGGAWDGDPGFSRHDADFSHPNDAFFAWMARVADEAAARGMLLLLAPMYLGYDHGEQDGWSRTLVAQRAGGGGPAHNKVCYDFGTYLANGHGAFPGFKGKPNILWVMGGDTTPASGSEEALRSLDVLKGMQAAGDTHLVTSHWQHDVLNRSQADLAPHLTAQGVYTHGAYPAIGPTYAAVRASYEGAPPLPTFLLETSYWGEHGATRVELRHFGWGAVLGGIGGYTFGSYPLWGFAVSPDGAAKLPGVGDTTSWRPSTRYRANQVVSSGGGWWRAPGGGTSGSAPPRGTGPAFADGGIAWAYLGPASWRTVLDDAATADVERMGSFLDAIAWHRLVPSGLSGTGAVVTAGGGHYATWREGAGESGGMDYVVAAADSAGSLAVAYVPDAHSGSVTVDMARMSGPARARWFDPAGGSYRDASGGGQALPNRGDRAFSVPGPNAAGDKDWVLVLDTAAAGKPAHPR